MVYVDFGFKEVTKGCSLYTEANRYTRNALLSYHEASARKQILPVFAQYVPAGHEVHSELPASAQGVVQVRLASCQPPFPSIC